MRKINVRYRKKWKVFAFYLFLEIILWVLIYKKIFHLAEKIHFGPNWGTLTVHPCMTWDLRPKKFSRFAHVNNSRLNNETVLGSESNYELSLLLRFLIFLLYMKGNEILKARKVLMLRFDWLKILAHCCKWFSCKWYSCKWPAATG